MVARQAADCATDQDRKILCAIVAEMRAAFDVSDFILFSQLNAKLHESIQRIAGNAARATILNQLTTWPPE